MFGLRGLRNRVVVTQPRQPLVVTRRAPRVGGDLISPFVSLLASPFPMFLLAVSIIFAFEVSNPNSELHAIIGKIKDPKIREFIQKYLVLISNIFLTTFGVFSAPKAQRIVIGLALSAFIFLMNYSEVHLPIFLGIGMCVRFFYKGDSTVKKFISLGIVLLLLWGYLDRGSFPLGRQYVSTSPVSEPVQTTPTFRTVPTTNPPSSHHSVKSKYG